MKRSYVVAALITAGLLGAPLAGCAGDSKNPSTGEIIDDTAISTKVRAKNDCRSASIAQSVCHGWPG